MLRQVVEPALQDVAVQPGRELGEVAEHDVGPGRLQLGGADRPGRYADGDRTRGAGTLDVADVVADVHGGAVLEQGVALLRAPRPADQLVDLEAEVVEVQPRVGLVLAGHDDHRAAVPAYRINGFARAGQRRHRRDGQRRVERAEPVTGSRGLVLGEPERELLGQRRPEPGHRCRRVDRYAGLGGQRVPHRGDTGPGVDQRHVEVEPDDEGSHPAQRRWLRRAGPAGPARAR